MNTRQSAVQRAILAAVCAAFGVAAHAAGRPVLTTVFVALAAFFGLTSALCWWIVWQVAGEAGDTSEGHEVGTDPAA